MRVLVTGATGFLGHRLTERLVEAGCGVVGLTRSPEGAARLEALGAVGIVGDLREPAEQLAAHLRRAAPEVVVHLAAELATQRSARRLHEVDVVGTRHLVDACLEIRGRHGYPYRLLYAGTVVVGDPLGAVLSPTAPLVATTAYGRAKLEAEALCLSAARAGIGVTVLRPSHIYGAGGWYGDVVRDLRRGRFFVPGHGDNLWDLVHVDDAVEAFLLAFHAGAATNGEIFHVVDDTPLTMREFFDATADALEVPRPSSVPVWLAKLVRGAGPVAAAVRSARSSNASLKRRLGWSPLWPDARLGLREAVATLLAVS